MSKPVPALAIDKEATSVASLQGRLQAAGLSIAPGELSAAVFGPDTRRALLDFQRENRLPASGNPDPASLRQLEQGEPSRQFAVMGTVRYAGGRPAGALLVRAYDRDMRSEQLLGEAMTDDSGAYRINYQRGAFTKAEKASADLLLRVVDGREVVFDPPVSQTLFNAPPLAVVNIVLDGADPRWQSEFELITDTVTPLLDGVALHALQEDAQQRDISFLAGETGLAAWRLAHFAVAQQLASRHQLPPEFFYALLAEDTLLAAGLAGAVGVRFEITLATDQQALFYDIVLLPPETVMGAVRDAVAHQYVPAWLLDKAEHIIKHLSQHLEEAQAYAREQKPALLFRQVERFLGAGKHEQVLAILKKDSFGNLPQLLERLQSAAAIKEPLRDDAEASSALADLLGYDADIIDRIREHQRIDSPRDLRQLARLDAADWSETLRASVTSRATAGTSPQPLRAALVDMHATAMVRKMEQQFPTTAFGANLERASDALPAQRETLLGLLEEDPEFDLANSNIDVLLRERHVGAPQRQALKATQRVFKIAPRFTQTTRLLDDGLQSAAAITALGESRFMAAYAGDGAFTRAEARETFAKASDRHTASALLAGELQANAGAMHVHALSPALPKAKLDLVTKEFPNMKSLFQTADYCACLECRSVHSAAAYVADTLQFLKNRLVIDTTAGPGSVKVAKNVLFARRPDLGDTDLSCENTNTPVSYIDVVCELLEEAIAPDPGLLFNGALASGVASAALVAQLQAAGMPFTPTAVVYDADLNGNRVVRDKQAVAKLTPAGAPNQWQVRRLRQTYRPAAEAAASPEYVNVDAYNALAASKFAFSLPFDLAHQETRSYFARFDVDRAALMAALAQAGTPSEADIATEQLGLSSEERQLITVADTANQKLYWNTGANPAPAVLKMVDAFVTKAAISYTELQELLALEWLNPGDAMFIRHLDNSCNLVKKEIMALDDPALDRLHRFMRVWKKSGIASATLDRIIRAERLGDDKLNDDTLVKLARMMKIVTRTGMPLEAVCNLYDKLEADGPASRYAQLFLNLSANGAVIDDFLIAAVRQNEQDEMTTPGSGKKLAAYTDYLALCLGAKSEDIARLVAALGAGAILSEASIAAVTALTQLARTLGLTAAELLIISTLTGIDPLLAPDDTLRYLDKLDTVRASGVSPADLQYLLVHDAENLDQRIMGDDAITALLTTLRAAYQQAFEDTRSPFSTSATADENKAALKDQLARLPNFTAADLSHFERLVDDAWNDPVRTPAQYIDEMLAEYIDTAPVKTAQTALAGAALPKEAERNAFIQTVLDALARHFYEEARNAALIAALAQAFKLDDEVAGILLANARLREPVIAGTPTLGELLAADSLVDMVNIPPAPPAITPVNYDHQYRSLRLLHTMTHLLATMKLPAAQVQWMLANNAALGWLELDRLMYQAGVTPVTFAAWETLQQALALIREFAPVANPAESETPFSVPGLFDLVLTPPATVSEVLGYLAQLTGWDLATLTVFDTRFGLSAVDLTPYRLPATYQRLGTAAALLRVLGLDLTSAVALIKPSLLASDSAIMRQALKARYQASEWLGVLKTVQDPLRQQKRDALVAYLLAQNPDFTSSNDLYDYFLIDVEMCSCMPTSRIVQAHATIQLFVQRCLMGLEPRSVANIKHDSGWIEWKWMANYRVWEANRKIFLYPENWIEPELRDDKSELYLKIEDTLQQNELTPLVAENAAISYLESLDDIAQLDVMATHYQTDISTMHVFARTKGGDPTVYYYRQFQKERYWTPWERIDLDITGDHLVAFNRNSRLTLAWPLFTEEVNTNQDMTIPNSSSIPAAGQAADKPQKRWKIQLAVSERAGGKWLAKKVSQGGVFDPPNGYFTSPPPASNEYNFFLWGAGDAGQAISCYHNSSGWVGSFALTGCKGYPEANSGGNGFPLTFLPQFKDSALRSERFTEVHKEAGEELAIRSIFNMGAFDTIVTNTPGTFKVTYPMQMAIIDWVLLGIQMYMASQQPASSLTFHRRGPVIPLGTFMPYFYGDIARTYVIIPGFFDQPSRVPKERNEKMFSELNKLVEDMLALAIQYLHKLQQDPAHDLPKLIEALKVDPEYLRLQEEVKVLMAMQSGLKFANFYHPLVCLLRLTLNRSGLPALMQRDIQLTKTAFNFNTVYQPSGLVVPPYPIEDIDFKSDGAYSSYNWELFFHLPFDIATRLSKDQRFEEAREWFHHIFNPVGATDALAPHKYWVTKPFFQATAADYQAQFIDNIMNAVAADPSGASIGKLKFAVAEWRSKPFKPHVIARSRPVAYQAALVMAYIKNLIDWGDNLFRQFTRESVTQATQMYILADKLLGPKPRIVESQVTPPVETYNQLEAKLDLFGNALLDLENMIPDLNLLPHKGAELPPAPLTVSSLYFCVPPNEKMLQAWDLVSDRLFKIRHCQNIDGVESILALFSPPIDPGALVRAAAGGLDISAFLAGMSAPLPHYRFRVMSDKANELVQQVGELGNAMLAALEKRDAEQLLRLRSTQEKAVLKLVRDVKLAAIAEAHGVLEGVVQSRKVTEERFLHYSRQQFMNSGEKTASKLTGMALIGETAVMLGYILSGGLKLIPDFMAGGAGFGGSPTVNASMGGSTVGNSAEMAAQTILSITRALDKAASMASTQAGYQRRKDEWDFQSRLAKTELPAIDKQILTAKLHIDMLTKDLAAHDLQAKQADDTDQFMRNKYTNKELYDWMIGQLSSVYFKAYKLAFDVAKKAERCFQHELGNDKTFLSFGYWNSLKKGLMTAEALQFDIQRMQVAYLDMDKRECELTKDVSVAQLDPAALLQLKTTGKCTVQIPEALFDLDHPGHYMRRHKSVTVSIPCITGAHKGVNCKVSLVSNRYRKSTALRAGAATDKDKYREQPGGDERFVYNVGTIQSVATSNARADSGLFNKSHDDPRYLPFEGTGVAGTWLIELPAAFRQFDYASISDVVLRLEYTARDGGGGFRTLVDNVQRDMLNEMMLAVSRTGLYQSFSVKEQFSDEWRRLKQSGTVQVSVDSGHLPFFAGARSPAILDITWYARVNGNPAVYVMSLNGVNFNLNRNAELDKLCVGVSAGAPVLGTAFTLAGADIGKLEDLTMIVHYGLGA